MTEYEMVLMSFETHNIDVYECKGMLVDSIIVPMFKHQKNKTEVQMVYEFNKNGKLISLNIREVA